MGGHEHAADASVPAPKPASGAADRVVADSPAALAELLRRSGGRLTPQRMTVLRRVVAEDGHLTALEVHRLAVEAGEALELSTVHRILIQLTEAGVLHCIFTAAGAAYGLDNTPHSHATCRSCGITLDVDVVPTNAALVAEQAGFAPGDVTVAIVTLCADCRAAVR